MKEIDIDKKDEKDNKKLKINFVVKINGIEILTIRSYDDILIIKEP